MDLQQLRFFLTCAEKGSLTRAAEALYTTQPHVSQVIRSLERELGAPLFRRTGSGVLLTEEGERIRFYAANALKNAALVREVCAPSDGEPLRLAANPSSRLAALACRCYRRKGGAALEYTECGIEPMMDLLQHRQYDLGFLFLPKDRLAAFSHMAGRRRLAYTPLLASDLVVYCGRQGPFFGRETVSPEELRDALCVQLEDDFFSLEDLLWERADSRADSRPVRRTVRTNSDHLMLQMLRETPLCNIGSYWQSGSVGPELSMARIEGFEGTVSFGYLHREGEPLRPGAVGFLEEVAGGIDPPSG